MTDQDFLRDPASERAYERMRKIDAYDTLRIQRAWLAGLLVGLVAGIVWEALRR